MESLHDPPLARGRWSRVHNLRGDTSYRPIALLTNSLDFTIWGWRPFGHHLTNYLLFLLIVGLVFAVVERLAEAGAYPPGRRLTLAALTALFFGVHPVRVEVVAWITSREHLVYVVFYLVALLAYARWTRTGRWPAYALVLLCAVAAGFSKTTAVSLPAVLVILDVFPFQRFTRKHWKAAVLDKLPIVLVSALTAIKAVQVCSETRIMHPLSFVRLLANALEVPRVLLFYVRQALIPLDLAPIYPIELTSGALGVGFAWVVLAGVVWLILRRRSYAGAVGLAAGIALLLPVAGLVRTGAMVLADRYVLLAQVPLLMLLAHACIKAGRSTIRWPIGVAAGCWLLVLIWKTMTYTALWDEPLALTRQAYDRYPESPVVRVMMSRSYCNVATTRMDEGAWGSAIEHFRKAAEVAPGNPDPHTGLGSVYVQLGAPESALPCFARAAALQPRDPTILMRLGALQQTLGHAADAIAVFERVLEIQPDHAEAQHRLAQLRGPR